MTCHALFMGVNAYFDPMIPSLECAENDAKVLHSIFSTRLGYEAYLSDGNDICGDLNRIKDQLEPDDTLVLYFSGHSLAKNDDYFLLLKNADSRLTDEGIFVGPGFLSAKMLFALTSNWDRVNRLLIVDGCNTPSALANARGIAIAGDEGLNSPSVSVRDPGKSKRTPIAMPPAILAACSEGQRAHELPEMKHGAFTYVLIHHLNEALVQGVAINIDATFVSALSASMAVLLKSRGFEDQQRPRLIGRDEIRLSTRRILAR